MKAGLYNIETNDFIASWDEIISNGLDVLHNYDDYYEEMPLDDQDLSPAAHIFDKLNKEDVPLKLIIPGNIERIGDYVFKKCDNLKEVVIENGVKEIGSFIFDECSNLTNIYIPDSVIEIGECAFDNCHELNTLKIPKSVKYIHENIFGHINIDNKKIIIQNELNKEFMDKFKNNIVYLSLDILLNEGKSLREISNIYKGNDDSLYR